MKAPGGYRRAPAGYATDADDVITASATALPRDARMVPFDTHATLLALGDNRQRHVADMPALFNALKRAQAGIRQCSRRSSISRLLAC